jgi:hypothetical protein
VNLRTAVLCVVFCPFACTTAFAQAQLTREQWGEKFNSPGVTLTNKELKRDSINGHPVVTYNLYAPGLPRGLHFVLWSRNVGGEPKPATDAYINQDGKVVRVLADPQRNIQEDPINLRVAGAKGQPLGFALTSDDGTLKVFTQIIPFPINVSSGPCSLSAIETGPYYSGMLISVTGLQPNEDLKLEQRSENEGGQSKAKADGTGNYRTLIMPFVKGKTSGTASFEVTASSCKIGFSFPWGQGSQNSQ